MLADGARSEELNDMQSMQDELAPEIRDQLHDILRYGRRLKRRKFRPTVPQYVVRHCILPKVILEEPSRTAQSKNAITIFQMISVEPANADDA